MSGTTAKTQTFVSTAPSDFIAKNEEITFSPNETSKTSTVTIVDDAIAEDDEVFELTISTPPDAPSGLQIALSAVTITLMDTDSECTCPDRLSLCMVQVYLDNANL